MQAQGKILWQDMVMQIVEVRNVSKKFGRGKKDFYALRDVSIGVEQGEIFGLLGPNGAGKTTLLNIIIGILLPDAGEARLFGESRISDAAERINLVSAETRFHWSLKSKDILEFYGRIYGIPKDKRTKTTRELAKFFGIENILEKKFSSLSTGERMRLILAKALLNEPELLLLDEPTVGLDPDIAIKVRNEIKRINKELGTTIMLTSHYMHEVEQLAGRIAFINRGRIVDVGSVDRVKLRKFATYDVIIKVKEVRDAAFLRSSGFAVSGNTIRKSLSLDENISDVLSLLADRGIRITDLESRKPTLEDYFVSMLDEKRRANE